MSTVVTINGFKKTAKEFFWKLMFTMISRKYLIVMTSIWVLYQLMVTKHTFDVIVGETMVKVNAPYLDAINGGKYIQLIAVAYLAVNIIPVVLRTAGDAVSTVKNGKNLDKGGRENGKE